MAEPIQVNGVTTSNHVNGTVLKSLTEVLNEVKSAVEQERSNNNVASNVKDLRWRFDQVSAKMNQAIYNDQTEKIHATCLETVSVLIEILTRTH